ncbi:MAG: hypothetical protein KAS07_02935 [Candidatus Pacebacteria bacterium]|nr:hypothetical protein [Candidatus Paceibacterota bacterium]
MFNKERNKKGKSREYFECFLYNIKGKKSIIGCFIRIRFVDRLALNNLDVFVDNIVEKILITGRFLFGKMI